MAENIGLKFEVKADSDQAQREIKQLRSVFDNEVKGITGHASSFAKFGDSVGLTTGQMKGLAVGATAAVAGIAALAGAATTAAVALFDLVKSSADYASEIFDATEKTGLSAEAMSALKFAADQSGSSMEQLSNGIKIFSKTVADAARGSQEAKEKLKRLGIDPQEAIKDLEGALAKAFKTINDADEGINQTAAAMDAFGSRMGPDMIGTIKSFDGNLEGLVARAKDLGVTFDEESLRMADRFSDAYDTITAQAKGIGFQFAEQLMPQMTQAMTDISQSIKDNQATIREWAVVISDLVAGVRAVWDSQIGQMIRALANFSAAMTSSGILRWATGTQGGTQARGGTSDLSQPALNQAPLLGASDFPKPYSIGGPKGTGSRGGGGGKKKETDEDRAIKLLDQLTAARAKHTGQTERERIAVLLETEAYNGLTEATKQSIMAVLEANEADAVAEKRKKLLAKALEAVAGFTKEQNQALAESQGITRTAMDDVDDFLKSFEKLGEGKMHVLPIVEALMRLKALAIDGAAAIETLQGALEGLEMPGGPAGGFFGAAVDPEAPAGPLDIPPPQNIDVWKNSLQELKAVGMDALGSLAQGIGNMVHEWVLMGTIGPGAVKKMVAGVLAGVAAQCAVLGVMELAYAAAAFTPWGLIQFGSPIQHLQSAAFFFAAAAAAGIAGRVVAGNSFQNAGAAGGAGASGGAGNVGGAPAARETNIIDLERNRPQPIEVVVRMNIQSDPNHIIDAVVENHNNDGRVRKLVMGMVEA